MRLVREWRLNPRLSDFEAHSWTRVWSLKTFLENQKVTVISELAAIHLNHISYKAADVRFKKIE